MSPYPLVDVLDRGVDGIALRPCCDSTALEAVLVEDESAWERHEQWWKEDLQNERPDDCRVILTGTGRVAVEDRARWSYHVVRKPGVAGDGESR
jgi:hypothetical protein